MTALDHGGLGIAVLVAAAMAPDLTLLGGFTDAAEPGVLAPRAVPAYNLVHHMTLPLLTTALGLGFGAELVAVAGAAWLAHVLFDRAAGYGLRTPTGHQRHHPASLTGSMAP